MTQVKAEPLCTDLDILQILLTRRLFFVKHVVMGGMRHISCSGSTERMDAGHMGLVQLQVASADVPMSFVRFLWR